MGSVSTASPWAMAWPRFSVEVSDSQWISCSVVEWSMRGGLGVGRNVNECRGWKMVRNVR